MLDISLTLGLTIADSPHQQEYPHHPEQSTYPPHPHTRHQAHNHPHGEEVGNRLKSREPLIQRWQNIHLMYRCFQLRVQRRWGKTRTVDASWMVGRVWQVELIQIRALGQRTK